MQIYADQASSLDAAIQAAQANTATGQPGDVIWTGFLGLYESGPPAYLDSEPAGTTVVGGTGNDLIINAQANAVVVAGSGNDTIVGGVWLQGTAQFDPLGIEGAELGEWTVSSATPASLVVNNVIGYTNTNSVPRIQVNLNNVFSVDPIVSNYEGNVTSGMAAFDYGAETWSQTGEYAYAGGNETIFGGAGASTILLSNGNNYVNLETGDSSVYGGMGDNTIFGGTGKVYVQGGGGNDYIDAGSGNDELIGRGGNNTILGGSGNDTIYAGSAGTSGDPQSWATSEMGDNYVEGGSGNSVIYGADGADTLIAGTGNSTVYGGAGAESITGGSGNDLLTGGSGNDTIDAGGDGLDTLVGQASVGSATYVYGGEGTDLIQGDAGTDVIFAGDGGTSDAPTSVVAGRGDTTVYGGEGIDVIQGGSGSDVLYAGDGGITGTATSVVAGGGNTTIYGGDGVDVIEGGSGLDVLYAGDGGVDGSPTTVLAGAGAATLYGGAGTAVLQDVLNGSDLLVAGSGDETLLGAGQDTLVAGSGNDYLAGGPSSTYVFGANTGVDEVNASGLGTLEFTSSINPSDVSLSAALDSSGAGSLTVDEGDGSIAIDGMLSGAGGIDSVLFDDPQQVSLSQFIQEEAGLGNAATTTVAGANGNLIFDAVNADAVVGGSGQDTISAWGNNDTLIAGSGGTLIYAEGPDDSVTGGSGDDTLDAIAAGTTLVGGTGNEVFEINDPTDVVRGQAAAAHNDIISSVSYTLPTNVDVLTLTGTDNLSGTGNGDAANVITANAGYDTLTAGSGADTLIAGSGHDTLVAGAGIDSLVGGGGGDIFVVDNSADVVSESTADANDTIDASVSYALPTNVDTLVLTGSADLDGTGNGDAANTITGNGGDDTLVAGSGADTLLAGSGIDTLVAGNGSDLLQGAAADTYDLNAGFGDIQIDPAGGGTVQFGSGVAIDSLSLGATFDSAGSASLIISESDGGSVTVDGALGSPTTEFQFAGGFTLSVEQLLSEFNVGSSTLAGANGNLIFDADANASVAGGSGSDTIYAMGTGDMVSAGTGNQVLVAVGDSDVLTGGPGADSLYAGVGSVVMIGGAGATSMYGGIGNDTYQLTEGGTVDINTSATEGAGIISLPDGMSLSDFTAYQAGEDLVLQSASGTTTAIIRNYFDGASNSPWFIQSQTDSPELLQNFVDSFGSSAPSYSQEVGAMSQAYGAQLTQELQTLGNERGSLGSLIDFRIPSYPPLGQYAFNGVSSQSISVTGNSINLPSSETGEDNLVTQTTTYTYTVPIYTLEEVQTIHFLSLTEVEQDLTDEGGKIELPQGSIPVYEVIGTGQETLTGYDYTTTTWNEVETGTYTEPYTASNGSYDSTRSFVTYNVTGNGGNDTITASGHGRVTGTVNTGNGDVYVNLGTTSGNGEGDWVTGYYPGTSIPLFPFDPEPGAFIQAGSGNDTLIGTDGNDVIAAGTGFDYMDGGNGGDTYLVPLQGYSTEMIADSGDPAPALPWLLTGGTSTILGGDPTDPNNPEQVFETPGPGQIPLDTLEMPTGITPQDLSYRLFTTPAYPGEQVLQLNYGNSNVLVVFEPPPVYDDLRVEYVDYVFNPITTPAQLGVDLVKFSDGTILTLDQLMQVATPLANDFDPTVTGSMAEVASGQAVAASSLFSAGDSAGNSLTWYQISNAGTGGGYFQLAGQTEPVGQSFMVNAAQLAGLQYVVGTAGTSDSITVSAFDGAVWSAAVTATVNATDNVFDASGPDQLVTGSTSGPDTLVGGYSGDTLIGRSGQDTFQYAAGSGSEVLSESASPSTSTSSVQFGTGLQPSSITLGVTGDPDLVLTLGSSGDSVSIAGFDPLNPLRSTGIQAFSFADGMSLTLLQLLSDDAVAGGSGSITNADGSTTTYDFTPTDQDVYYAQDVNPSRQVTASFSLNSDGSSVLRAYDGQGQEVTYDATYADDSTNDTTVTYNSDGTSSQTEVSTPADGGGSTTKVYGFDASGNMVSQQATYADGSTDNWTFTYNSGVKTSATEESTPAGGGSTTEVYGYDSSGDTVSKEVTNPDGSSEDYTYDTQGRELTVDVTNADGSTVDATFSYNSDGTSSSTNISTPAGGGSSTTTAYQYDAQGKQLSENSYTPATDGGYADNWEKADGSSGSFWWNASTSEYQETWYNTDGSHWTDDYQYASEGSPGATGYSFVETYGASDGSQGTREYNASTGAVTLSWDSAATGSLSGTTSDSGFIGLQNEGELTNTQQDPTFFNPQVSTSFNAFLAAH